jgi:hypothetical protein
LILPLNNIAGKAGFKRKDINSGLSNTATLKGNHHAVPLDKHLLLLCHNAKSSVMQECLLEHIVLENPHLKAVNSAVNPNNEYKRILVEQCLTVDMLMRLLIKRSGMF